MKPKFWIPLFLACLTVHASAFGEKATRTADELVTTLLLELKQLGGEDGDNQQVNALQQYLRGVKSAITQSNIRSLDQYLDNLGNYTPSDKVQKGIDALKQAVRQEYEENTRAVIAEMRGRLDQARDAVARAAEPEDLDKIIESFSSNRISGGNDTDRYNSNDATFRKLQSESGMALRFVTSWQDFLQASNAGDSTRALQSLRNLSNQENSLIPRSAVIARMQFETVDRDEIARIATTISSLDGMKPALAKLTTMLGPSRSSSSDNQDLRTCIRILSNLEKCYREHLAGLPVNLELFYQPYSTSDSPAVTDFIPQRSDLLLLVLPRYLNLPDDFQVEKGESVDHLLKRALEDAVKRDDPATARHILKTGLNLARTFNNEADMKALSEHSAGLSQIAAGQHALAVVSLQKALASGSHLIPAASTGAALAAIKRDHPEAYDEGMTEFLTPRPVPEPDHPRMPYRNQR